MKNNIDFARLNQEFEEFLHDLSFDFFQFKEEIKKSGGAQEDYRDYNRIIQLIEECMEEQQYWIIGQAFNKGVQFVQKYDNPFHDYSYSFWDILEESMAKDLFEYDAHNQE